MGNAVQLNKTSSSSIQCDSHSVVAAVKEVFLFFATHLHNEVSPAEVSDGPGEACAAPDEAQEERALRVGEGLHHVPEPLDERCRGLHPLIGGHRLQQVQWDVGATTHLGSEREREGVEGERKEERQKERENK